MTPPPGLTPLHTFPGVSALSSPAQLSSMNGIGLGSLPFMSNSLSKTNGSLMLNAVNNGSMLGTPSSIRIGSASEISIDGSWGVCLVDPAFSPMSGNSPGVACHTMDPGHLSVNGDLGHYATMESSPSQGASPVPLSKLRLFVVVHKVPPPFFHPWIPLGRL